ncbi:MAG: UDP-N-acetylglucosamine 2-epimerase (non-hydrolyzing) [Lentisphaeria bacterium]|nr:UDP-N-acetylglucosamine 2-epimerase (non-hydrolyzing) [Lentisphaeria bacterium]
MKKILIVFGTRPEAIKLCPLVNYLKADGVFQVEVCVTGQHREMLDQVLRVFNVVPDADLQVMRPNQTLAGVTGAILSAMDEYLQRNRPDMVVIQGDTTTVMATTLAAFYHHIPIAHVEAGLRTGNLYSPWPEEGNRVITSHLADLHFCPTMTSRENLLREGIAENRIFVTGNTVIDALFSTLDRMRGLHLYVDGIPDCVQPSAAGGGRRMVLITGHRRENFGEGFRNICNAIGELADKFPEVSFVYPVHLNPQVRGTVADVLSDNKNKRKNIFLIDPLTYEYFVAMMQRADVILTDSGGVQEEAPSLGKPVLVMRDTTERPEALAAGTVKLVGTDRERIVSEVSRLLTDPVYYEQMANAENPYGDGKSCQRIGEVFERYFAENR